MGNHLGVILKDCKIFSLIVLLCKSWYLSNHTLAKQIVLLQNIMGECVPDDELDAFMCAELHLFMANIHCNNENFEACYHELIRVLDLQPMNVNAMRYLYEMYRRLRHDPKIERTIKRQFEKRRNEKEYIWHELILGHSSFSKNSYDIAANTYSHILSKHSDSPFMHLMMAITFLQHAMKRTTTKTNKYFITIQGIAFMKKYVKLSKNNTQSLYNFARSLHLLGFYSCAQNIYQKIINQIKYKQNDDDNDNDPIRRYCAYNLSKIYQRSGQHDLAIQTLRQNIII